jgi:hypothetical protein
MHCQNGASGCTILDTEVTGLIGPAEGYCYLVRKITRKWKQLGTGAGHLCNKGITRKLGWLSTRSAWNLADQNHGISTD